MTLAAFYNIKVQVENQFSDTKIQEMVGAACQKTKLDTALPASLFLRKWCADDKYFSFLPHLSPTLSVSIKDSPITSIYLS